MDPAAIATATPMRAVSKARRDGPRIAAGDAMLDALADVKGCGVPEPHVDECEARGEDGHARQRNRASGGPQARAGRGRSTHAREASSRGCEPWEQEEEEHAASQ